MTTPSVAPINFIKQKIEEDKKKLKSSLGEITSGNSKHKRGYQLDTIKNVQSLYDSRQIVIDLFNYNANIRSEAIYKSKQNETTGTGLKILTPEQMLQRLPTALA